MSNRLNKERQIVLEPERIGYAKSKIESLGFNITRETSREIQFEYNGHIVKYFPYSGWHTGKTINDGRGLDNLLNQLKHEQNRSFTGS